MQPGSVSPQAMHEHLVQQGFDPAIAAEAVVLWQSLGSPADAHDPFAFRLDLGLPEDPRAMSLDELDQLIGHRFLMPDGVRELQDFMPPPLTGEAAYRHRLAHVAGTSTATFMASSTRASARSD